MATKLLSEYFEGNRKANVYIDFKEEYYFVDFFENDVKIGTEHYPHKSMVWAEDCAENWVLNVKKVVDGD